MLRLPFVIFSVLLMAGITACSKQDEPTVAPIKPVKFFQVGGSGVTRLEYPGQVSAASEATLAFEVPGRITSFPVVEGQDVKQGELLAQLDLRDYESTVSAAKSSYEQAKSNFARGEELIKKNFISQVDFDQLRNQASQTKANLDRAQKALDDATIRAPFDGKVAKKIVDDYANVQAKQSVLVFHSLGSLEVVINIPEGDWARVTRMQKRRMTRGEGALKVQVAIAGFPGKTFPAVTREISTTANPTTRTYAIRLSFTVDGDEIILPGMTAQAFVDMPNDHMGSSLEVPVQAVAYDADGAAFVWVVDYSAMTVSKRLVQVGQLSANNIEVISGIESGEILAASGVHYLSDGAAVREFK